MNRSRNINDDVTLAYLLNKVFDRVKSFFITKEDADRRYVPKSDLPLSVENGGTGHNSVDTAPAANSTKMVTSGGVKTAVDGKVSKTGDTMSGGALFIRDSGGDSAHQGRIILNNPNITFGESHTETVMGEVMFDDAATNLFKASIYGNYTAANTCQIVMRARNWVNGEAVLNTLALSVQANGTRGVDITDSAPWRKALGLGDSSGAFPITIAQGGSGQTATTKDTTISNIVTAASGCSVTFAEYAHWGKIAQVRIGIKKTAAVTSGNTTLGTIASGKRPAIYALVQTGSAEKNKKGSIAPNGTIVVNGAIAANEEVQILSTYILA